MKSAEICGLCPMCGSACGIVVRKENGRVVKIYGDERDPISKGYICPKGAALMDFHNDPDRLTRPMKKVGQGKWEPVEWDAALKDIVRRTAAIQKRHGRDSVGLYVGTQVSHIYRVLFFLSPFMEALGTKNFYTANSVDARPRMYASKAIYDDPGVFPVPDIERTGYFLVLGANPVVSNGSIMTAPGFARRIREMQARRARVVVLDPRKCETAELADEFHFIRPGSDALFLLAALNVIFEEGLASKAERSGRSIKGMDRLREIAGAFAPERAAEATGVAAQAIRKIARDFCAAKSAVCYGRMGVSAQTFGTISCWLIDALNIVTGNCDRPGGAMFSTPAVDLAGLINAMGMNQKPGRWKSRVGGFEELGGELPVAALADEIETPGDGQLRAMFVVAGNPVLAVPNGRRLDAAFEGLEFMVSIDPYRNETSRHADYILPPTLVLEHDNYPVIPYAFSVRDAAHWAPAILEPPKGVKHDWEIFWELTRRLLAERTPVPGLTGGALKAAGPLLKPGGLLRLALALGPHGIRRTGKSSGGRPLSLSKLKKNPSGVDLGPLQPGRLKRILGRKAVQLAPPELAADVDRLKKWLDAGVGGSGDSGELLLISRRHLRSLNTSAHNVENLAKGKDRCTLQIHPDDAKSRRLTDGDTATIRTRVGELAAAVKVSDEMMPGVVSLPFGWGHDRPGCGLSVAAKYAGVSVNDLTDERLVDELSGTSVLNGIPATVRKKAPVEAPAGAR